MVFTMHAATPERFCRVPKDTRPAEAARLVARSAEVPECRRLCSAEGHGVLDTKCLDVMPKDTEQPQDTQDTKDTQGVEPEGRCNARGRHG